LGVAYRREGESNNWKALTGIGSVYRGIDPKGVNSYLAPFREDEKTPGVHYAMVNVLVEFNPEHERAVLSSDTDIHLMIINKANAMAEELFKRHHPDAVVSHEEREVASFPR
jgi:hypothetical protein